MSDSNITPDSFPRSLANPRLAGLPAYLKDPANFKKIEKAILNTFFSTCSHSNMLEWAECPKCTKKMLERRLLLKKLGFKNPGQYMAWKKIHQKIIERYPLMDWKNNRPLV